nr:hypothetical protein [Candidatus Gracilibacteria bacterium]
MKILFVVALPLELKIIKQEIKKLEIRELQVDFLLSGVGNYNTIYNLKEYIERSGKPDFIVNLGVCGKIEKITHDFIQVYRIKNLSDNKEKICPVYIDFGDLESITSSEEIVSENNKLLDEKYVDMESFGVDFIASKEKIPYIILKIPFDEVGVKSKQVDLKKLEESFLTFPYKELFDKIQNYLERNIKEVEKDLSFYKKYFKLTFSEYEILKRNYNKFLAYGLSFEDFFENNKDLTKEKFIDEINKK